MASKPAAQTQPEMPITLWFILFFSTGPRSGTSFSANRLLKKACQPGPFAENPPVLSRIEIAGPLLVLILVGGSVLQILDGRQDLPDRILRGGRVVLGPGLAPVGSFSPLLDGDPQTAVTLRFPGPPPEGSYVLADLSLTHFPALRAPGIETGPRPRRAGALRIFNGICANCQEAEFREFGRVRRARVEILVRRANDPDVEFEIPPARVVWSQVIDFPDRPGAVAIPLAVPDPLPSAVYPVNVFYIICKIAPLEQYPGTRFPDRLAIGEIQYFDLALDNEATLHGDPASFVWNVKPRMAGKRPGLTYE